jgi:hypothetical protein
VRKKWANQNFVFFLQFYAQNLTSFLKKNCFVVLLFNNCRGVTDGFTFEDLEDTYPEFYKQWTKDRLRTRFPGGESYLDLIQRLEPCVVR